MGGIVDLKNDLEELANTLNQQRDEIELQLHLAGMEVKDEWQHAEKYWSQFIDALGIINDDTKEVSTELIHATKVIGDELIQVYRRILHSFQ
jgi:predicted NUDIX family phosphoesterase